MGNPWLSCFLLSLSLFSFFFFLQWYVGPFNITGWEKTGGSFLGVFWLVGLETSQLVHLGPGMRSKQV